MLGEIFNTQIVVLTSNLGHLNKLVVCGFKALYIVSRGGVAGPAGPALAGPLFSGSLVLFPDCIGTHVLRIRRAAASDMAHSTACSSSAFQSSPTRRPIAETPHQPSHAHARVIF